MSNKIVHYSTLPTAAAPYHIWDCLTKYTDLDVRLVQKLNVYSDTRAFPKDMLLDEGGEKIVKECNILHLHNDFPLEIASHFNKERLFGTLHSVPRKYNWSEMLEKCTECFTIRQPMHMIEYNYELPSLPTLFDIYKYTPIDRPMNKIIINFAPTNKVDPPHPASKAYHQVAIVLKQIEAEYKDKVEIQFYKNKNHLDDLNTKQRAHIVIDDVCTHALKYGSLEVNTFHLTGLFGASFGCCVLSAMNVEEMQTYYYEGFGKKCKYSPFYTVTYKKLYKTLKELIENKILLLRQMEISRKWMEEYYNPKELVHNYEEIYQ